MLNRIVASVLGVLCCAYVVSLGQTVDARKRDEPRPLSPQQKVYSLREILALLEETYHVHFLYEDSLLEGKTGQLAASISNDFFHALKLALSNSALTYEIAGSRTIVIVPKQPITPTGNIRGVVRDETGAGIPFAQVMSEDNSHSARANAEGEYVLTSVPAGVCKLIARTIGHRSQEVTLRVRPSDTVRQNFSLTTDALSMGEIVVTGSRNPQTKIESSVAITTANAAQIAERAPRGVADLLQVVPGFYVESSGGEVGNNLFARGIPADGSFRYVTIHEDGLPVFEASELAFVNIDELVRLDVTVEELEAMRGSTGAIFASNAPAGIINFISKTGSPNFSGTIKTTIGDYGLLRTEANFGGPLRKHWFYSLGGFYRYDRGIRDPGFPANRGGQIKANVTRTFTKGYLRLHAKWLNDRNIFYTPIPVQNPERPSGLAGFDPNFGTLTSSDFGFINVPAPNGERHAFDLREGIHPRVRAGGFELSLDLGEGWNLKNSLRAMAADLQFNAIFSIFNPTTAAQFAQEKMKLVPNATGFEYRFAQSPEEVLHPNTLNGNGLVVESGWWAVHKPMRNLVNHLQLTKRWQGHELTGGIYLSDYAADDFWYWQNILSEVRDRPRALDLRLLDASGNALVSVTADGFTQFGTVYVNARNEGFVAAQYLQDEWKATESLRLAGGLRYEYHALNGARENHGVFNLGEANTLADDRVIYGDGTFRLYDFTYRQWAFSLGGNYRIKPDLALYARGSKGFRTPDFDQFRAVNPEEDRVLEKGEIENVVQLEGGIKLANPQFALSAALFLARLDQLPFDDEVVDPVTGGIKIERRFANSTTQGLELEAVYTPEKGAVFDLIATVQNPRLRDFTFTVGGEIKNFGGNRVRRIPTVMVDFRASYEIAGCKFYGSMRYIGERFVDDANEVLLPDFAEVYAGISRQFSRFTFALNAANVFNTVGLTEGNPRFGQVIGVRQNIYLARPILGRTLTFATTYAF